MIRLLLALLLSTAWAAPPPRPADTPRMEGFRRVYVTADAFADGLVPEGWEPVVEPPAAPEAPPPGAAAASNKVILVLEPQATTDAGHTALTLAEHLRTVEGVTAVEVNDEGTALMILLDEARDLSDVGVPTHHPADTGEGEAAEGELEGAAADEDEDEAEDEAAEGETAEDGADGEATEGEGADADVATVPLGSLGRLEPVPDVRSRMPTPEVDAPRSVPRPQAVPPPEPGNDLVLQNVVGARVVVEINGVKVGELGPKDQAVVHDVRPGTYVVGFVGPTGFERLRRVETVARAPTPAE